MYLCIYLVEIYLFTKHALTAEIGSHVLSPFYLSIFVFSWQIFIQDSWIIFPAPLLHDLLLLSLCTSYVEKLALQKDNHVPK